MRTYWVGLAVALIIVVVIAVVVAGGGSSDVGDGASAAPRDPMTGRTEFDLPVQDATLVAQGAELYRENCAQCHGSDLRGTAVGPPLLSVIYNPYHHSDEAFVVAAVAGVRAHHWNFGDMPPIAAITQDDMTKVIAFIRETQRTEGFVAYP